MKFIFDSDEQKVMFMTALRHNLCLNDVDLVSDEECLSIGNCRECWNRMIQTTVEVKENDGDA